MKALLKLLFVILIVFIFFALQSCRSAQEISNKKCAKAKAKYELSVYRFGCPLGTISDSSNTSIESSKHDTTIYVPVPGEKVHDTIKVEIINGIVNSVQSRLDTEYAYATAQIVNSILVLNLYQKE